jgi:DNA end-binding protein Ku
LTTKRVRSEKDYFAHMPPPRISKDMVSLAKLVQRKAKGHAIEAPEPEERPGNLINLMDALREGVRADKKHGHGSESRRNTRKPRARRRKAA